MADILLIAGLSGAGRSQAADDLEDVGWFVVDNLPISLIDKVVELADSTNANQQPLALVVGAAMQQTDAVGVVERLRQSGHRVRVLFMDAATPELVRRYVQTRRKHPLAQGEMSVEEAIDIARRCEQAPDATLLALIFLSAQETRMYSGTHAMLVSCVCMVVAREMLRWSPAQVRRLGAAGLTMNIAMTELQDQLAQQTQPLTARQIAAVEDHAARSAAMLAELGVTDAVWLEAVRHHHHRKPGPFAEKTEGEQMARLIQRADVFGARISPRASRWPMPVTAAMKASYYDEENKVDEAGAALVKGLGVYPPGAFVRLASQEVGVVLRRGISATTPRVAVVTNRLGMPTGEFIPRDTSQPQWKITGVVAHKDVRVKIALDRLLPLV